MEWKETKIGKLGQIITGKTPKTAIKENWGGKIPFLSPSDDMSPKTAPQTARSLTDLGVSEVKKCLIPPNSICVSCIGSDLGKVVKTDRDLVTNQQINTIVPHSNMYADYVYYLMCIVGKELNYISKTSTAVPIINKSTFSDWDVTIPCNKDDQRRIASILSSLDRKIELNNKINADLEEMAQAIFKNWFVDFEPFKDGEFVDSELGMIPEGWEVGTLTEIASYMNGLAMQKYPPENNQDSLPVLKIKELGQGFCGTDSDRCSCNIKDECKIHNGDVIFSWSGTLLVDVWCGGDCGLNQHLFKVTSKDYPKWFYYYWTKHHLQEFIHIAKDKAVTMGHIKRGHLEEAMVAIPDNDSMEKAHELFEPILSKMISLRLENSRLSLLRDTLLPRLMSGEIEIPE